MSNVLGNLFGEIANAIRAKTGGTDTMKPAEFPTQIAAIPTGGGSDAGEWVMATGEFTATSDIETITHGLGVVPDIAFIAMQIGGEITGATRQVLVSSFGVSQRLGNSAALVSGKSIILGSSVALNYTLSPPATIAGTTNSFFIDLPEGDAWFPIHSANANTIGFGDTIVAPLLTSGEKYGWCVMALKGGGSSADVRYVTFVGADGAVLYKKPVAVGDDCVDVVAKGLISTPTKESTAAEVYTYSGWSLTEGGAASSSALKNVTEDRTVYAAFETSARTYTARFYDDAGVLMQESQVAYGTQATPPDTTKEGYAFVSWTPSDLTIYGDTDFVGEWEVDQGWLAAIPIPTNTFTSRIYDVAYSPDGTRFFCAEEKMLYMFDATTTPYNVLQTITTNNGISGIAVNSSGTMLAVVMMVTYNVSDIMHLYTIGASTLTRLSPTWSDDALDNTHGSPRSVTFSPDGSKVYYCSYNNRVVECSLNDYTCNEVLNVDAGSGSNLSGVAVSPDGTKVCAVAYGAGYKRCVAIADLANSNANITDACFGTSTTRPAYSVAYSPDGKYIAIGYNTSSSSYASVKVYDTSTTPYSVVFEYKPAKDANGVAFSEDGTLLFASISGSPYLCAWEVGTWAAKDAPLVEPTGTGRIAISGDDTKLAVGYYQSPYLSLYKIRR